MSGRTYTSPIGTFGVEDNLDGCETPSIPSEGEILRSFDVSKWAILASPTLKQDTSYLKANGWVPERKTTVSQFYTKDVGGKECIIRVQSEDADTFYFEIRSTIASLCKQTGERPLFVLREMCLVGTRGPEPVSYRLGTKASDPMVEVRRGDKVRFTMCARTIDGKDYPQYKHETSIYRMLYLRAKVGGAVCVYKGGMHIHINKTTALVTGRWSGRTLLARKCLITNKIYARIDARDLDIWKESQTQARKALSDEVRETSITKAFTQRSVHGLLTRAGIQTIGDLSDRIDDGLDLTALDGIGMGRATMVITKLEEVKEEVDDE